MYISVTWRRFRHPDGRQNNPGSSRSRGGDPPWGLRPQGVRGNVFSSSACPCHPTKAPPLSTAGAPNSGQREQKEAGAPGGADRGAHSLARRYWRPETNAGGNVRAGSLPLPRPLPSALQEPLPPGLLLLQQQDLSGKSPPLNDATGPFRCISMAAPYVEPKRYGCNQYPFSLTLTFTGDGARWEFLQFPRKANELYLHCPK